MVVDPKDPDRVIAVGPSHPWTLVPIVGIGGVLIGLAFAAVIACAVLYQVLPETYGRWAYRVRRRARRLAPPRGVRRTLAVVLAVLVVWGSLAMMVLPAADLRRVAEQVSTARPLPAHVSEVVDLSEGRDTSWVYIVSTPQGLRRLHHAHDPDLEIGETLSVVLDPDDRDRVILADAEHWTTAADRAWKDQVIFIIVVVIGGAWLIWRILPREDWARIGRIGQRRTSPTQGSPADTA